MRNAQGYLVTGQLQFRTCRHRDNDRRGENVSALACFLQESAENVELVSNVKENYPRFEGHVYEEKIRNFGTASCGSERLGV